MRIATDTRFSNYGIVGLSLLGFASAELLRLWLPFGAPSLLSRSERFQSKRYLPWFANSFARRPFDRRQTSRDVAGGVPPEIGISSPGRRATHGRRARCIESHHEQIMRVERAQMDLETTNRLRRAVAQRARLPAELTVEAAVAAVMCALTERLTAGEAFDVLTSIPSSIAAMFEPCVLHRAGQPTQRLGRAELLQRVADHLSVTPAHAEVVCSAVFTAMRAELPADVVMAVAHQLPRGLRELWLGPPIEAPDLDVAVPPEDTRRAVEKDLDRRAKLPPHVTPSAAFAATMCIFAHRLSGGETRHVLLGLPPAMRALVESCATHREERAAVFGRDELLREVGEHLATDATETARIVREVLRAAKRALPQRTIAEIESQLPADLRELWQAALPAHEG
jgi:uncharacterized protein (DUF2267 family)